MPENCISALYKSLEYCAGEPLIPGIRAAVYFIPKRDIVTFPKLPKTAATAAAIDSLSTYNGDFVLADGKSFHRLDLTPEKGLVLSEAQGEDYSRTYLNKTTLHHPKNNEAAAAFARQSLNDDLLYVVQQRDGKWRVLGNEMFKTKTTATSTTGEGATSEAGMTVEIEVTDVCPAPFYVGALDTEDGEIDCSGEEEASNA